MKKELLSFVFLLVIAVFVNRNAIFAIENKVDLNSQEVTDTKVVLQDILEKRALLFNSLANNKSEFLEIKSELKSLEVDPLYKYDIEAFALLKDKPSEIDIIKEVSIVEILDYKKEDGEILVIAKVKWVMEDIAGRYVESRQYSFRLILDDDIYKLKDYVLDEN